MQLFGLCFTFDKDQAEDLMRQAMEFAQGDLTAEGARFFDIVEVQGGSVAAYRKTSVASQTVPGGAIFRLGQEQNNANQTS